MPRPRAASARHTEYDSAAAGVGSDRALALTVEMASPKSEGEVIGGLLHRESALKNLKPNLQYFFSNRERNSAPAYLVPFTCRCNSATGVPRKFLTAPATQVQNNCPTAKWVVVTRRLVTISDRNSPSKTREEGKERRRKRGDLGREGPWLCVCTTAAAARRRSCPRARGAAERSQPDPRCTSCCFFFVQLSCLRTS